MQTVISALGGKPAASSFEIPHFRKTETSQQLIIKGKPKLLLAGELQNSSLSSARYMSTVWQNMKDTHYNTLLGCITWEDLEPEEGKFDFTELDQVILGAREYDMHLILLWFGSFKNGVSTYVPPWVKKDHKRFPRAKLTKQDGSGVESTEVLSLFGGDGNEADAKAVKTLLKHLKEFDGEHSTVIMVQIENETGLLGDSRDRNEQANKRFAEPVPNELIEFLSKQKSSLHKDLVKNLKGFEAFVSSDAYKSAAANTASWEEVFGASKYTDEIFMAYHYAHYLNRVAGAGKAEYPIPLYTNVWQNYNAEDDDEPSFPIIVGGGQDPGVYPSGGGVTNTLDIWKAFATNLDFIAPDIYLNSYPNSCANYRHNNNTLFIPEQRRDDYGARRSWVAFGSHQCIGTSPFGVDTIEAKDSTYTLHYGLLEATMPIILEAQARHEGSYGFFFDEVPAEGATDPTPSYEVTFSGYKITIERSFVFGKQTPGAGMIIHYPVGHPSNPSKEDPSFLLIGFGFHVYFASTKPTATFTGFLTFEEKEVVNKETGELRTLRKLNGDETRSGKFAMMPSDDPDYGDFPISVTIPARTRVARIVPYHLEE